MQGNKLKSLLILHNETTRDLAMVLQISEKSVRDKINGKIEFKQNEIVTIKDHYQLSAQEVDDIFFYGLSFLKRRNS